MAEEILAILESILNHPAFQVGLIVYISFSIIILIFVANVFSFVLKKFSEIHNHRRRKEK